MDSVALREVSFQELQLSPTIVTVALLHNHFSFIRYLQYGLSIGSVSLRTQTLIHVNLFPHPFLTCKHTTEFNTFVFYAFLCQIVSERKFGDFH